MRRIILGAFHPHEGIKLYPDRHGDPAQIDLTVAHEHAHKNLCGTTTFGLLQTFVACLAGADTQSQDPLILDSKRALTALIDSSWLVHEGWACYSELRHLELFGGKFSGYPDDYADALSIYVSLLQTLPTSLRPFHYYFVRAVLDAAMNTPVLELPVEHSLGLEYVSTLIGSAYSPDRRLLTLAAAWSEEMFSPSMVDEILAMVEQAVADVGLTEYSTEEAVFACWRTLGAPYEKLRRRLDAELCPRFVELLSELLADGSVLSRADAQASMQAFVAATVAVGERIDIRFPQLLVVTNTQDTWPLLPKLYEVAHKRPDLFSDVVLKLHPSVDVREVIDVLQGPDRFFVVWILGGGVCVLSADATSNSTSEIRDIGQNARPRQGPETKNFRANMERLFLVCNHEQQNALIRALGEPVIATVIVTHGLPDDQMWEYLRIPTSWWIGEFGHVPIALLVDMGSSALTLLRGLQKFGVASLVKVYSGELSEYLLVIFEEGIPWLLEVPKVMLGLVRIHEAELFHWMESRSVDGVTYESPEGQAGYVAAVFDRLGAFVLDPSD